jgi:hypothetical protein
MGERGDARRCFPRPAAQTGYHAGSATGRAGGVGETDQILVSLLKVPKRGGKNSRCREMRRREQCDGLSGMNVEQGVWGGFESMRRNAGKRQTSTQQ